jgi:predicted ATPase
MKISKMEIKGFRSLKNISWAPDKLNVIIGPNGAGKSNFLRLLELMAVSAQGRLGKYVQDSGGMEPLIWDGLWNLALYSERLAKTIRHLTMTGLIRFVRNTISGPWLDPLWVKKRLESPFQLRLI